MSKQRHYSVKACCLGLLLFGSSLLSGCTNLFFVPDQRQYLKPEQLQLSYEDVALTTADGVALHAWYFPAVSEAKGTVLFLHGNGENISSHIIATHWLPGVGYNLLALDYRGFGRSAGRPSMAGVHLDIDAAMQWLADKTPADQPLIIYGQSLGGALSITSASRLPATQKQRLAAVVADSPFSSPRLIAREKLSEFWLTWPFQHPLSWTISDEYSPIASLAQLAPIPLLLIHGSDDVVVPASHSARLFAAAAEPKAYWQVPDIGHIEFPRDEVNQQQLQRYLDAVVRRWQNAQSAANFR